jgi:2'-5' RNA ligase
MIYEYLLIISPDEKVNHELLALKERFKVKYHCTHSSILKPHLTLVSFLQTDLSDKQIKDGLRYVSKSYRPFTLHLNKIDGFETHSIYVSLTNKNQVVEILNELRVRFRKLYQFDSKYQPSFAANPHITIARNMSDIQYYTAMKDWENTVIDQSFEVAFMSLLKRAIGSRYQEVEKFHFTGETPSHPQLALEI